MLPKHFAMELMGDHIDQDILAVTVVCMVDFSPGQEHFIGSTSTQCMLTEEEHESGSIVIQRAALFLYDRHAFDDVGQMDLFLS